MISGKEPAATSVIVAYLTAFNSACGVIIASCIERCDASNFEDLKLSLDLQFHITLLLLVLQYKNYFIYTKIILQIKVHLKSAFRKYWLIVH